MPHLFPWNALISNPIRLKEQLAQKSAPDSCPGHLGVIKDFKTWLETGFLAIHLLQDHQSIQKVLKNPLKNPYFAKNQAQIKFDKREKKKQDQRYSDPKACKSCNINKDPKNIHTKNKHPNKSTQNTQKMISIPKISTPKIRTP